MTLREAYEFGQEQLKKAGIDDAILDAWYLLEFVTGVSRAVYFLDNNKQLGEEQEKKYCDYVTRRAAHIPLQHITGTQEFMGFEFCVNEHVLVPRQDTEALVESVLENLKPGMDILDMCTGSGCILISLMRLQDGLCGTGVDISQEALEVACENAKKHNVDIQWVHSDLFEKVDGKYDVIVSNPPYIRTAVIEELKEEVKFHDPFLALDGKADGLYFYRRIIGESPKFLKRDGRLCFEIGHDQGDAVSKLMQEAGFRDVIVKKDLAGLDRVVFGVYNV